MGRTLRRRTNPHSYAVEEIREIIDEGNKHGFEQFWDFYEHRDLFKFIDVLLAYIETVERLLQSQGHDIDGIREQFEQCPPGIDEDGDC